MLKLKVVSDGTWEGTKLVNADTDEPFAVEGAHVSCNVQGKKDGGSASVNISLTVPVEVTGEVAGPFAFLGHNG